MENVNTILKPGSVMTFESAKYSHPHTHEHTQAHTHIHNSVWFWCRYFPVAPENKQAFCDKVHAIAAKHGWKNAANGQVRPFFPS